MRRFIILLAICTLLTSCNESRELIDSFFKEDKSLAKVVEYKVIDNSLFSVKFSETVEIVDVEYDNDKLAFSALGSIFTIRLPSKMQRGERHTLSLTAVKENGNTTRASFLLWGKNEEIPYLLINELSIKGNTTNPDRVELSVLTSGNTAGIQVTTSYDKVEGYEFSLPELEVKEGDLIVIYWNTSSNINEEERELGKMTYYLNAESPTTLSGTKGVLLIKEEYNGPIMDCIIYANEESSFGENLDNAISKLKEKEYWQGDAIDSSFVTSSRVLARLPDNTDTDSSEDWFTTKAKASTFGNPNVFEPYVSEE